MTERPLAAIAAALASGLLLGLAACSPKPAAKVPPIEGLAAVPATQTPAPPAAQNMVMVCRNSQTGAKADCGSPGAVMVGMKPQ